MEMKMKQFCLEKSKMAESTFSFGLSQKVNDAQPEPFVELTEEELEETERKSSNETQREGQRQQLIR